MRPPTRLRAPAERPRRVPAPRRIAARGALLPVAACVLLLCACGSDQAERGGRTQIVLAHWMGGDRALWEQEVIEPFEAAHPHIDVRLETAPYSMHATKTLTAVASGARVGDLVLAEEWFAQELFKRRYTRNLMPYATRDLQIDDYFTDTFREWRGRSRNPDELYGFPVGIGLTVLFYNKDVFDAAGLPYPDTSWTYDDLVDTARRLTVDENGDGLPERYGLSLDPHYPGTETIVYSFGGRYLNDDQSRAVLSEPATRQGFQFLQDLYLKHRVAAPSSNPMNPLESFIARRAAMMLIGSYAAFFMEAPFRWDLTMPPKGPGGKRLSRRFSIGFVIPKDSPHPDEAWLLLRWILTQAPPHLADRLFGGLMPASRRIAESEAWLEAEPAYNRWVLAELQRDFSFPLFTPGWQEWRDNNLTPALTELIRGRTTVDRFAPETEAKINAVLSRAAE